MPETATAPSAPQGVSPEAIADQPLIPSQPEGDAAPAVADAEPRKPEPEARPAEAAKPAADPAAKPAAPEKTPEKPAVPAGYRPEDDFRRLQSQKDSEVAALRREVAELRRAQGQQAIETQVEATKRAFIARLESAQLNPADFQAQIQELEGRTRGQAQEKQRADEQTARMQETEAKLAQTMMAARHLVLEKWVQRLARDHKLEAEDTDLLGGYISQDVLLNEDLFNRTAVMLGGLAERFAKARGAVTSAAKAKQELVPPDGGGQQNGAVSLSDDEFLKKYSEGEINDHKRANEILARRGF